MTCADVEARLGAYLDGELAGEEGQEIARHLAMCEECAASAERYRALRAAVLAEVPSYRAPETLRTSVREAIRASARGGRARAWVARALAVAAAAVLVVSGTWTLASRRVEATLLAEEVLAAHVRSLMPGHLTDVASTDQHTVKPWFDGRLDFSPPVSDGAARGYPLVGGRLDYVGERPVAALVYGRRLHRINVFVWPAGGGTSGVSRLERNGYHLYYWRQGGMALWAVSDLNPAELEDFVGWLRSAAAPARPT